MVKLKILRIFPLTIVFFALVTVLAGAALAQEKVGVGDGLGGFQNAFYTVKLIGTAAYARGGSGVVTQAGAAGFLANPANLRLNSRFEIHLDGGLLRDAVDYRPGTVSGFVSSLTHNASDLNMLAVAIRAGRFTAGLSASIPREFENVLHSSLYETTYQGTILVNDSLFFAIKQWQFSAGIGTDLYKSLHFGFAVHLQDFQLRYQNYGRYASHTGMTLNQQVLLFQAGLKQTIGDFCFAMTLKSPEDTELGKRTTYQLEEGVFPVRIPAEFAAGAVYHDLISGEFKILQLEDNYYENDFLEFGGGLHLPLTRLFKHDGNFANIGILHRSNPEYYGENVDQTFLNLGIELSFRQLGLAATLINGSALGKDKSAVHELAIGLNYRSL